MFHMKHLFYLIVFPFILSTPQINLHYTDVVSENDNNVLQHSCLRVAVDVDVVMLKGEQQIIFYCINDLPSKFNIKTNDFFPKFTFNELSKQNVTSQQLYLWSAPMDVIEHYQFYLNQLSTSNDLSLANEIFYNCTLPRFGPVCQYEFDFPYANDASLKQIVRDFYDNYHYDPTNFTCYTHLQCNRGPYPSCLDWSEICNGKVDCLDGDFDEEHCWQFHSNTCEENEYQCLNGQCIPQALPPVFGCEDMTCQQTPLTDSCVRKRHELLLRASLSIKDKSISDKCWTAFTCLVVKHISIFSACIDFCKNGMCVELVELECPDMLYIPAVPVLFGHIYFAYHKHDAHALDRGPARYPYVCYNNSMYDAYFINVNASAILFNNTMCYYHSNPYRASSRSSWSEFEALSVFERDLWEYNRISKSNYDFNYVSTLCNRTSMYQCAKSLKCIRTVSLWNSENDCPYGDDEVFNKTDNAERIRFGSDLISWDDYVDRLRWTLYAKKSISFQIVCDGFTELLPVMINGRNVTDETECEHWECNNVYTHCNRLWNCANGLDEVGCNPAPPLNCSSDQHLCVSLHTGEFICLPIEKANDGTVDCLGAADEPTLCRKEYSYINTHRFYCIGSHSPQCLENLELCNGVTDCDNREDERYCTRNRTFAKDANTCVSNYSLFDSDVEKFMCGQMEPTTKDPLLNFSLDEIGDENERLGFLQDIQFTNLSTSPIPSKFKPRCHRGLDLRFWLNDTTNLSATTCLCPPSFYGDLCQYQNQRVSLTIKFQTLSDSWQTLFAIVISLIDDSDQRIIHSYEQISYLSIKHCLIKFHIYLLYLTRPKNAAKHYSIHIDIYEKLSLTYRGSFLFPIAFPFLPVHRLALVVDIPRKSAQTLVCSHDPCSHGTCTRYANRPENVTFCRCDLGWAGRDCTTPHFSQCSPDSVDVGVSANNQSVCVCPIHKFGRRCLLLHTVCQTTDSSTCLNNGQCIPSDDYIVANQKFICVCPNNFTGDRCELTANALVLSFAKDIDLSQSLFIHFIELIKLGPFKRATFLKTMPLRQRSVIVKWLKPFHLAFIELLQPKTYYLAVVQNIYNQSTTILKTIKSSDRCRNISEVFNETLVQLDLLRRIKYYQLPCQIFSPDLQCFYDDVQLCICYNFGNKRLANCLEFNHNMTFDCSGQNICENNGQCFQDDSLCPTRSICICPRCYYGAQCQFRTSGFALSLDAILGYHISSHLRFIHQPAIVQFSLALTIILLVVGLINGVLSVMTFKNKSLRQVGCGLYLLGSSITALFTMIMFGLKFVIFNLAQMNLISNRSFLSFQCHSMDFLLRISLNMDQWFSACVAIERAVTILKGTNFEKKKSKQAAKFVIIFLLVVIVGTSIYDPIYRRLIDEENDDEKRVWCIATYPRNVQIFDSIIHPFHVLGPFIINLVSSILVITAKSRQKSNLQPRRPYKEHLREQLAQHKSLFTAPVLLAILALPRIIFAVAFKCMKSANDSWLYLVAYFMSFIPATQTFVIFVLPSDFYKEEFLTTVEQYQTNIRRCLLRRS